MRNFKELEVWELGKYLAIQTYNQTKSMPKEEMYGLTSQMRRAAISIPSNIAEGCSRSSNKEFVRFLEIAIGSSFELKTQLIISAELEFLDGEKVESIQESINQLQKKINSFIKSVKKF